MSQEKVDRYKKEKANRAKILKKKKREAILYRIIGTLVCVVIIGFIGFSAYKKWGPEEETTTAKYTSLVDADTLRETLIANGEITTEASESTTSAETTANESTTASDDSEATTVAAEETTAK